MSGPAMQIYIRTILLVFSWIIFGLCGEIIGPTMGILAYNAGVTFNGIASALASLSAGGLLTNILCGIFQNFIKNYPDLMLTTAFFLPAIIMPVTPFINSLLPLCIVFFTQGVSASLISMGGTDLLFKIWHSRAAAPFSIVHFGYGLGAIFANLIVRPFLSTKNSHLNATATPHFNTTVSTSISLPLNSDIRVPYLIAGGLCFLTGVGHLIFFIQEHKNKRDKAEIPQVNYAPVSIISSKTGTHSAEIEFSQYSPVTCGHGYFGYGLALSSIFTAYIFSVSGTEQMFAKFYFSFLKFDKFDISTAGASWGIILFWLCFSIGRLIGAVASVFIPLYICLTVLWCGGLLLAVMWIVYVWILGLAATSLFVLGSLTGLIIGPLFPLSLAWINEKLNMIPPLLAALLFGRGLGSLILQKIGGFVMDRDPNHFPTLLTACVIVTIILYIISNIIIFFHQRTLKNRQCSVVNDVPVTIAKVDDDEEQQMTSYLEGVNET